MSILKNFFIKIAHLPSIYQIIFKGRIKIVTPSPTPPIKGGGYLESLHKLRFEQPVIPRLDRGIQPFDKLRVTRMSW